MDVVAVGRAPTRSLAESSGLILVGTYHSRGDAIVAARSVSATRFRFFKASGLAQFGVST